MEILVVEDEAGIADFLARGLEAEGYSVTVAADGIIGERLALSPDTDLVVLDRMLPGRDGIEVLATIRRSKPALPVILLTAKTDVADRVEGLDLGATDYITKPFAFDELLARIRARLRESDDASETALEAGGIRLDLLTREATRGDHVVRLPDRESELLAYLMRHAGQVCTREEILSAVWDYDHDPGTNVVQVYVGYLRRKLGLPGSPAADRDRSLGGLPTERPRMRSAWTRLGLRGRLALSIGTIVVLAFAVVFVAVRAQMSHESAVIKREEAREPSEPMYRGARRARDPRSLRSRTPSPTSRRRSSLIGGASPGRRAARRLSAGGADRLAAAAVRRHRGRGRRRRPHPPARVGPCGGGELRTLAEAFNHMLDRLDRAFARQRQFVSDASHELRSPLTAIRGQLEVLARNKSPSAEEIRRVEAMTMTEMRRVERLVDDLLALARLDEGVGPALRERASRPLPARACRRQRRRDRRGRRAG